VHLNAEKVPHGSVPPLYEIILLRMAVTVVQERGRVEFFNVLLNVYATCY
jgi:hypothetical protein